MEREPVEEALVGERLERAAGLRRALRVERDLERAAVRLDRRDVRLGRVELRLGLLDLRRLRRRLLGRLAAGALLPAGVLRGRRLRRRGGRLGRGRGGRLRAGGGSSSSSPQAANAARDRQASRSAKGLVMGGDDNERRCRSDPPSPATTMCCSISTAACGSATTPSTAPSRPSPRCARPARASPTSPTTSATRPTSSCASCGGSASRPASTRSSPSAPRVQFVLAERRGGGAAFVIGSQALVDHVAEAGLRIVNNTEFATRADVVVVGGAQRLRLPRAADRHPGRAARRRADRRRRAIARSRCPTGRGPPPAPVLAAVEDGDRAGGPSARSASPSRGMYETARDRLGAGPLPRGRRPARHRRRRRAARGDRQRARASAARPAARRPTAAEPRPTYVADVARGLVLALIF